jgi:hypothetical protein
MKYNVYDEFHTIGYFKTIDECIEALVKWNEDEEIREIVKNLDMTKDYIEIETEDNLCYIERIG